MTTTTNPYPRTTDKVQLFRENGVDTTDYHYGNEDIDQAIRFIGGRDTADIAVDVALRYGLPIIELAHFQDYDGKQTVGSTYWILQFRPSS